MTLFNVAYEVWNESAVEAGDTDERGFELEGGSLRDAIGVVLSTRTSAVDGQSIEPSSSNVRDARWISVNNGMEYETGAYETRALHIPESVTGASRVRIARLLGVRV